MYPWRVGEGAGGSNVYYWNELEQKLESKPSIIVKDNNVTLPSNSLTKNAVEVMNANTTACVVETWHSGTSWYRVWSDGWIEQGGWRNNRNDRTFNLYKPYTNINYTVLVTSRAPVLGDSDFQCHVLITSNSQFHVAGQLASGCFWVAYGY